MNKRTRIINDPSELVPLLQIFGSKRHKKVFDALLNLWMTKDELEETLGTDVAQSIKILKKSGLIDDEAINNLLAAIETGDASHLDFTENDDLI